MSQSDQRSFWAYWEGEAKAATEEEVNKNKNEEEKNTDELKPRKITIYIPGTFIPISFTYYVPNGKDGYTNQYENSATSLDKFEKYYRGKTEDQIVFGQSSFLGYTFPNNINNEFRYVTIGNGREIDMIHFIVVGRRGFLLGMANEIKQSLSNSPSAFYPQDLYSNQLGINFFKRYGSKIEQHPTSISQYITWFLSNSEN